MSYYGHENVYAGYDYGDSYSPSIMGEDDYSESKPSSARGDGGSTFSDCRMKTVDTALLFADAQNLERTAKRYKKAAKEVAKLPDSDPRSDLVGVYNDIHTAISDAAFKLLDYRKRILDGEI